MEMVAPAGTHVYVKVKPAPQISLTASDTNMCAGGKVTLNFSGADSYSWSSIDE